MPSEKTVIMLGCFDTKAEDFNLLYQNLLRHKVKVITINTGILGTTTLFDVTIEAEELALNSGTSLASLRKEANRSHAIEKVGKGAKIAINALMENHIIDGVIGMGGGGGTYIFLSAIQGVPFGVPKVCLSTLATKDLSNQIGSKDVLLMPSIVDVAGINQISTVLIGQAAGALVGMMDVNTTKNTTKTIASIAVSVFGNTTPCVERCSEVLRRNSYDVLSFHAVGTGGKTMEDLVRDQCFDAVLDITTTELADDLCGGICSAGPTRLTAAGEIGIPQVVVPGCLDMVNFGALQTVPQKYRDRQLFSWGPDVTLMRTNEEENRELGKSFAEKLNRSKGKVAVLLPLRGISKISRKGEVFYDPQIDHVLFETIRGYLDPKIRIIELDTDINDIEFANAAVSELLNLLEN